MVRWNVKNIIATLTLLAVAIALIFGIIIPTAASAKNFGASRKTEIQNSGSVLEQILGK